MKKAFPIWLFLLSGLLIAPPAPWAQRVSIHDGRMSVDLQEASLVSVAGDIERQAGISFKGDDSLLEERVSVAFKDLPLEQGIKRILASLNYSLLFDTRGEISEVVIMSEGSEPAGSQPRIRRAPIRRAPPSPAQRRPVIRRPGTTSPLVSGEQRSAVPIRPRATLPRRTLQRPVPRAPSTPQAPAGADVPEPLQGPESAPLPGEIEESEGPLHPAFRVMESKEIPSPPKLEEEDKPGEQGASREEADASPQQD